MARYKVLVLTNPVAGKEDAHKDMVNIAGIVIEPIADVVTSSMLGPGSDGADRA